MDILKLINKHRRKVTQRITRGLSKSNTNKNLNWDDLDQIKNILICRANHRLGNLLLIIPFVLVISITIPDCKN